MGTEALIVHNPSLPGLNVHYSYLRIVDRPALPNNSDEH